MKSWLLDTNTLVYLAFSIVTDMQFGPENGGSVGTDQRVWHFSAWYRLGIGYRF